MKIKESFELDKLLDVTNYNLNKAEIVNFKSMLVEDGEVEDISIERIKRYHNIIERIKKLENSKCQVAECRFTFKKNNDEFYSEAHHIIPLSEGGSQSEINVVVLCPNHHRMFHYAKVEIIKTDVVVTAVTLNGEKHKLIYERPLSNYK